MELVLLILFPALVFFMLQKFGPPRPSEPG